MIGMMNVPCESPTEFYATPTPKPQGDMPKEGVSKDNVSGFSRKSTKRISVLMKRRLSHQTGYLNDGRKIQDGKLVGENVEAPKLWENLLLRSLATKIEEEIASPTAEPKEKELFHLIEDSKSARKSEDNSGKGKKCTNSTWSLVSKQQLKKVPEVKRQRSLSLTCCPETLSLEKSL